MVSAAYNCWPPEPEMRIPPPTSRYSLTSGISLRECGKTEREAAQLELLRRHLELAGTSEFYREKFQQVGLVPSQLRSLAELHKLPLTERADLNRGHGCFFPAADLTATDLALTSGTTGNAVTVPYTSNDLERLAYNEMIAFFRIGIKPGQRVLLCVTLDRCFIAGLAYYTGLVRLGATAIRSGAGSPSRQWELIRTLNPSVIVGVPTFLWQLAQWGLEHGLDPTRAGIETLVTIGEPIRKADLTLTPLGEMLEKGWGAKTYGSYGATELETAFVECPATAGGHVHPELMLVEIIDETGTPVPDGQPGEVVVTPLGVEGLPLVRFRTGDVARLYPEPCSCGWQTPRLGPIEGRLAQRLKCRGTTLYPENIFQAIDEIPGIAAYYVEARAHFSLADEITVVVGGDEAVEPAAIQERLQAKLRVKPEVIKRSPAEVVAVIEKGSGRKMKRFFDFRKVE